MTVSHPSIGDSKGKTHLMVVECISMGLLGGNMGI